MNAWLDTQLDPNAFTQDEHEQVRYARRNSDLSRFYDIDDVQSQGPTTSTQKINSAQLDINIKIFLTGKVHELRNRKTPCLLISLIITGPMHARKQLHV